MNIAIMKKKESAKEYQEVSEKILNLIEKQQKEIEELKEGFKIQEHNYQVAMEEIEQRWEDKIKAKIEEYDDKGMTKYLGTRSYGKTFQQVLREELKKVLQSLLEEE